MFICFFGVREMDVSSMCDSPTQNGMSRMGYAQTSRYEVWKDYLGLRIEKDYLRLGKTFLYG